MRVSATQRNVMNASDVSFVFPFVRGCLRFCKYLDGHFTPLLIFHSTDYSGAYAIVSFLFLLFIDHGGIQKMAFEVQTLQKSNSRTDEKQNHPALWTI